MVGAIFLDAQRRPVNIGGTEPACHAIGASRTRRTARLANYAHRAVLLTTDDIARLTGTPARTVRERLARWRREGAPVVRAGVPVRRAMSSVVRSTARCA
jgi:hypothetical protein